MDTLPEYFPQLQQLISFHRRRKAVARSLEEKQQPLNEVGLDNRVSHFMLHVMSSSPSVGKNIHEKIYRKTFF